MLTALIALGIFATVVLLFEGGYYAYQILSRHGKDAQRIKERLREWSAQPRPQQLAITRKQVLSDLPWLHEWLSSIRKLDRVRRVHERAGTAAPFGTFALSSLLIATVGGMIARQFHAHLLVIVASAVGGGALPFLYLYYKKAKRMAEFQRQFPEALELIARALRAGHAFFIGMKLVGEEFADPVGSEFKRGFDEVSMGISVPQALQNLAERMDLVDVKFFVTSVNVQRETGGNLAEIIESLAHLIRKRFELQLKVKALSAEGKLSAIILFALPFAIGLLLYRVNPEYIGLLFSDALGHTMLMVGAVLMTVGALVTKKMITIEV